MCVCKRERNNSANVYNGAHACNGASVYIDYHACVYTTYHANVYVTHAIDKYSFLCS